MKISAGSVSPSSGLIVNPASRFISPGGGGNGLNPSGSWNAYTYTGSDQTLNIPGDYAFENIQFKIWGAGGGSSIATNMSRGAPGGYVTGLLAVNPSDVIKIVVGQAGTLGTPTASKSALYGGGGAISDSIQWGGGQGGGYSGIFATAVSFANAIAIAGGGGGGGRIANGAGGNKGWGGGPSGGDGYQSSDDSGTPTLGGRSGTGGSQIAGGTAGSGYSGQTNGGQLSGGSGGNYGGGTAGGGYYGGGGGAAYGNGGGGSCYWNGSVSSPSWYMSSGTGSTLTGGGSSGATGSALSPVPQSGDSQYQGGVGVGGESSAGTSGLVQIFY